MAKRGLKSTFKLQKYVIILKYERKFEKNLANSNHILVKSGFSFTFFLLCRSFCCINTIFS